MQTALRGALGKVDNIIHPDWSTFSYDPATGFLNLVIFVQPAPDGACGGRTNNHLLSHRHHLLRHDHTPLPKPRHAGSVLPITEYTLPHSVGRVAAVDSTTIKPL